MTASPLKNGLMRYRAWLEKLSKRLSRQGLYEFLTAAFAAIPGGARVLSVGAGGSVGGLLATRASARGFDIVSIDIDPSRSPNIVGDICTISFAESSFDVAVLAEVLEHLHSPPAALKTVHAALKPGGRLILTTPFILPMHDRPHDYFRFTCHGLELLLRDFRQVDIAPRNSYFEAIDVLWVRLLQAGGSSTLLSFVVVPLIYFAKRPLTHLLRRAFPTDAMTTGYTVSAVK